MLHPFFQLAPSRSFWTDAARALLNHPELPRGREGAAIRIVVPTALHVQSLKAALAEQAGGSLGMPRILTLSSWLASESVDEDVSAAQGERLMTLYAELRQHGWLKKLFGAKRNTDLLPLAQTLLGLSDELTQSLLPRLRLAPDEVEARWQAALTQLTPAARQMLSDEAQLVWSIWKGQLDGGDANALRFARMMHLAESADAPLVWIAPAEMPAFDLAFLQAYGERQTVLPLALDWSKLHPAYAAAWPELDELAPQAAVDAPAGLALCRAANMEEEALLGAQTVIDWLAAGKSSIAIVAQDRAVARRMRALLDRARVTVADETGWKLSTTRAAAALAAWFDVVASRADTAALLDLLKSPFVLADLPDKSRQVMRIEAALRGMNVLGGWEAVAAALRELPEEAATLQRIADSAARFTRRKTLSEWLALTDEMLDALDMRIALAADAAGEQVLAMLAAFAQDYQAFTHPFSFAEWRALVCMQLESTDFVPLVSDRRVVMLPLNGARLRSFDAVLLVGADAAHLPSHAQESLFFGDAVRRELDLPTRASLQLQQLRDFAELLSANADVVLSWQTHKSEEDNPVSPWIARLELALARAGKQLREHAVAIAQCKLQATPVAMPAPSAPQLLPEKISASAYNSLAACPYQFFAQRMLGLSALEELSDLPQKRDYGDWLHKILKNYHDAVREQKVPLPERAALLRQISDEIFGGVLNKNAAALGYYMRWQKAMPAYLDWANERESEGWQIEAAEKWFEKRLQWPGGEVTLHGRIDRIDSNDAGEWAVLDYKTSNLSALRGKLGQREDHQLAFYGLLADRPVAAAHYVALEPLKEKTGDVAAPNYGEWQQQLSAQIVNNLRAIGQGAALPAAGIEAVCVYCDVRGLCRKGAW